MSVGESGERRVISSAQTFSVKFFGPAMMLPLAALMLWMTYHHTLSPYGPFGSERAVVPAGHFSLKFLWVVTVLCFLFTMWWSYALKRVAIDDESIYISDYSREFSLPLAAIVEVRENRWLKMHPVTIVFDRTTPWGSTIRFMPKIRYFAFNWMSHPIVAELRDSAFHAQAGRRAARGIDRLQGADLLGRALARCRRGMKRAARS